MLAIIALDPEAEPPDHLVIRKPLAKAARGMNHEGGELWPDTEDPAYQCLVGWLAGAPGADLAGPCTDAASALER